MQDQNVQLLTKSQTAKIFKVKEKTLENWRVKGFGPRFVRIGGPKKGRVFYRPDDITEYIESVSHASTSDQHY